MLTRSGESPLWDLNHAERRALAASVFLVGLAGVSRLAWTPPRAELEWRSVSATSTTEPPVDAVAAALVIEARAQTPLGPGERIDIGSAPVEELRRLSGVGPGLAVAIVRERTARPFRSTADIERVPGIGPATADRLKDMILVTPPAGPVELQRPSSGSGCGSASVDINAAGSGDLQRLPGVGPTMAARILALRVERGRFSSTTEIADVKGIGPASLSRIQPLICVQ
ncbi:MAG: ComEA family DNA-binding protein [Gemmatimonadota bacterium]